MKAQIHQIAAALIAFVLLLSACVQDLLDPSPQTDFSPHVFFNTEEDVAPYGNGLIPMTGRETYLNDQSSDNAATTGAVEIEAMMTGTPSSQTITGGWNWERLRDINYFLENYGKAAVSPETKNHYAG